MDTKIFLEGFNSKKSVNTDEGLNVGLKGKRRLLPTNDVADVISQFDQYQEERKTCNVIRLTCQVNPICSNVLFNKISEIIKDEGSDKISYVNYGILQGKIATDVGNCKDNYVDYGEDEEKLRYKERCMAFWNRSSFNYQKKDDEISILAPNNTLSEAISKHKHDGNATVYPTTQHSTNSIRDMQLSNCGYVYHCGLDIFNNHLVRSKTFKCVCKMPSEYPLSTDLQYTDKYEAFNTIADLMRDINGEKVVEKIIYPKDSSVPYNMKFITMHLYKYDDVYSFNECINKRLIDTFNGWVGFDNKPKIKTYEVFSIDHRLEEPDPTAEEKELHIERPIIYMNGSDFVDMYPDRSLYSFMPKFNHFRNRIEKNWNYCLTYPSSSTTEGFEDIIDSTNNSLKVVFFDENTKSDNGVSQLVIHSVAKHGLAEGDDVNIYLKTTNDEGETVSTKIIDNARVAAVVDDYIFTVFNADMQISKKWVELTKNDFQSGKFIVDGVEYTIMPNRTFCYVGNRDKVYYIINGLGRYYVNIDDNAQELTFKKVANDIECEYYVRIFSKIPNFKNASADTSNEYQIYKNDSDLIHTYQDHMYDFESHVSRLAFAKNIYTDEVGELVFTDDIDISNLKDNLGRPLSSIYITFIKNNKGYKEWYGFDCANKWEVTEITNENVEYSHCFGKIKCGFETSEESTYNENAKVNSIYKLSHGNSLPYGYDVSKINGEREYENYYVDDFEVWPDIDKNYFGDLCYYDNYNAIEKSIQPVMHRFNTAQRESIQSDSYSYYENFAYDEIVYDDYDASGNFQITSLTEDKANDRREGYYYNPHYEIRLKTFDKIQTIMPDFLTIRSFIGVDTENTYRITTLENHYLTLGDKSMIYDKVNKVYYYCTTVTDESDTYNTFTCKIYGEKGEPITSLTDMYNSDERLRDYRLFKMDNLGIPSYATVLRDGSCRVIWRDLLNNGFNMSDNTVEEYPFTNGAFYINRRVDIFVRRQDPFGTYGLRDGIFEGRSIETENDNYVKDKEIVC